jgi:hypothetical protein
MPAVVRVLLRHHVSQQWAGLASELLASLSSFESVVEPLRERRRKQSLAAKPLRDFIACQGEVLTG